MTMTPKWLWLIIGVVAVAVVVGVVVMPEVGRLSQQVGLKYPYLPAEDSQEYIPTKAEWKALVFTARVNAQSQLTEKLFSNQSQLRARPTDLWLHTGTQATPKWPVALGGGRFSCSDREVRAAYEEAADVIMKSVRASFPSVSDKNVKIRFSEAESIIGTWTDGKMTLEGEE